MRPINWIYCFLLATTTVLTPLVADPAQAATKIEDYGTLPAIEDAAISPSGFRIALVRTVDEMRTLVIIENGKVVESSQLGSVKVRDVEWANDDLLLVDYSQTEALEGFTAQKAEFYRTIVLPVPAGKPEIVFSKQRDIADATFGWYGIRKIDGKNYGFIGGVPMESNGSGGYRFAGGSAALYRVDLADLKTKLVASRANEDEWRTWRVDESGNVAATLVVKDIDGAWKILNAAGKEIATGKNGAGGVGLVSFGKDGSSLIYRLEEEISGVTQFYEIPLAGGTPTQMFNDINVDRFYVAPATGRMIGYRLSGKAAKVQFFDPALNSKVAGMLASMPTTKTAMADWNANFDKVILQANGNRDSGTWWLVDLSNVSAKQLGREYPNIAPSDVGSISTISYKAADGLTIEGILTLPPGKEAKNLPAIMLPHGGPTAEDTESFDWWAQALAARGYAVLQPNFRGSTNKDAAFVKAGHGEWGRKMQTDISDGLAHLASKGIVDPKRTCIVGASYGGYAALAGVTLQQGIYRCAVSVAGVSDLAMMVSTDVYESGNNPMLKRNLKSEIGAGRELKDVSPRRLAQQADAPILLIHGKDDTVVPFKQSSIMADALKNAGKPFEMVTLAGEDHWLSKSDTRLKMLTATIAFVEKHNPPN